MGKSKKSHEHQKSETETAAAGIEKFEVNHEGPLIPQETKEASLALLYLFFFSVLMFTLPFGVFYGLQYYLKEHFANMEQFEVTCWSVLAAVLTVNVVIGSYVWLAWKDAKEDEAQSKQKTS